MLQGTPGRRDLDESLRVFGVAPESVQVGGDVTDYFEVWPECEAAVRLFIAARTQWRVGPRGAIGLDYAVLPLLARSLPGGAIRRRALHQALPLLQVMEDEALEWFAEQSADE